MRVELRPLRQDAWSGITKYKNCYTDLAKYWTRSGSFYTGLTIEDAERLGAILNIDLKPNSKFWDTFYIRVGDRPVILETDDPMDELRYLFLKNHKRVKTSLTEHKATADFVLINQEEIAARNNEFSRLKRQAFREFDKMTPEERRKALRIFGKSAENVNDELVESRLSEIVEGNPGGFIEKWVNNKSRETQYLLERAVSMNILRKNKRAFLYGTDIIGHDLYDAIIFLEDPKNQDLKISLLNQINAKNTIASVSNELIKKQVTDNISKKAKAEQLKEEE